MKSQSIALNWPTLGVAIPIGVSAALVTLAFRQLILLLNRVIFQRSDAITQAMTTWPTYCWPLIVGTGGVVAGLFLRYAVALEQQQGVKTDYLEVINARLETVPTRTSLFRALSSIASISSGASIGKEGPMVQLAALVGSLCSRLIPKQSGLSPTDLVAMAAAAGLASVYHAPLASAVFVAEVAFGISALQRLIPLVVATASAVMSMWMLGYRSPLYALGDLQFSLSLVNLALVIVLGASCGLLGSGFIRLTHQIRRWFARISALPLRLGFGGLIVGSLAMISPAILGNGYEIILNTLAGHYLLGSLVLLLLLKILATSCSVGSGAVGGMFTPSLLTGALGGAAFGLIIHEFWTSAPSPWLLAVLGMAAVLAAISQAPLMAMLMVLEMTLNSSLLFPLMIVTVLASMVTWWLQSPLTYPLVNHHFTRANAKFAFDHTRITDLIIPGACVQPSDSVGQALTLSTVKRERYVYVTDAVGTFLGVVSIHKIAEQVLSREISLDSPVAKVIEEDFPYIYQNQSLREGWEAFAAVTLERLPVLNNPQQRHFVGALTKTSLIQQAETFL